MDIVEKINNHLRILAPHVAKRETATLLRDAADEIEKLRYCLRDALEIGYGAVCNWPTVSLDALIIEDDEDA